MYRIMIVEDDPYISHFLQMSFEQEGYRILMTTKGHEALSLFYSHQPDIVILDLGLPDIDGLEVIQEIRKISSKPIIVVSARLAEQEKIKALDLGANDYVVNFAQLTQRAGNFLVAREKLDNFKWEDLKGKKVLGGRKGGMPEMVFEYTLKKNGIDPSKDLSINQNIDFGSTAAAFAEKKTPADFTVEFEPGATNLEKEGKGYVVASLGTDSGYVPYTAFCAKQSYIKKNASVIQNFTNALQKGMDYVQSHSPEEIASVIAPQFKETDHGTITTILTRYYNQDTWKDNLIFEKKSFDLLQDILESSGELTKRAPYDDLVTTTYAEKAAER